MQPLERSSIEAYSAIIIALVQWIASLWGVTLNFWFGCLLTLILIGLMFDAILRSKWTVRLNWWKKATISIFAVLLVVALAYNPAVIAYRHAHTVTVTGTVAPPQSKETPPDAPKSTRPPAAQPKRNKNTSADKSKGKNSNNKINGDVNQNSTGDCSPNTVIGDVVVNCGPPPPKPPKISWNWKPFNPVPSAMYRVVVSIDITNPMPHPAFSVTCDRPCRPADEFSGYPAPAGYSTGSQWIPSDPQPETVYGILSDPNPAPDGSHLLWRIASDDGKPIQILHVRRIEFR